MNSLSLNQSRFAEAYKEKLTQAILTHPEEYAYPVSEVEIVVSRMLAAIDRNSFNNSARALAGTCKALGIKSTRKAILEFWNGGK